MYTLAIATTAIRIVAETRLVLANVAASGKTAPPLIASVMTARTISASCSPPYPSADAQLGLVVKRHERTAILPRKPASHTFLFLLSFSNTCSQATVSQKSAPSRHTDV